MLLVNVIQSIFLRQPQSLLGGVTATAHELDEVLPLGRHHGRGHQLAVHNVVRIPHVELQGWVVQACHLAEE